MFALLNKKYIIKRKNSVIGGALLEVHVYFLEGHSEVNTLDGEINVFLNKDKEQQKIWNDLINYLSQLTEINNAKKCKITISKEKENQKWHHSSN